MDQNTYFATEIEQSISNLLGEIQKDESNRSSTLDTHEQITLDLKNLQQEINTLRDLLQQKAILKSFV